MSYINDALRKAQSEKDSRYRRYSDIVITAAPRRRAAYLKWVFVFLLVVAALALGFFYASEWNGIKIPWLPESKPIKATIKSATVAAPKPAAPVAPDIDVLFKTALDLQKNGQLDEAERIYQKILALQPLHLDALNNIGVIYMSRNRNADALAVLNRAVEVKDANADPYYNLACIHARMGDTASSLEYLKKAIALNPEAKDWAKDDQDLNSLKKLPRFKKLMKQVPKT